MRSYLETRKGVLIFALSVMLITCVPYLIGFQVEGSEWNYSGFVIGLEDGNSYISKMLSGASGDWLFRSKHTTSPQQGVIAYFPYLLLGKLASDPGQHTQLVALYHGFRIIAGFLAIAASYELIAFFLRDHKLRWWALFLITLGGGLGWVLVAISQKGFLGSLPLDFISPESFGFIGLFGFPHLAAARGLFVWGLYLFLVNQNGSQAGITWLVMSFFQPMVGVVAWVVIWSYTVIIFLSSLNRKNATRNEDWKRLVSRSTQASLISAPIVVYTAILFLNNPYFIAWNQQNRFLSPHPLHYLLAYGLVIPFAVFGIRRLMSEGKNKGYFLFAWLLISPILIYAPVVSQRRLAEGLWVCLIIGMLSFFDGRKIPRTMPFLWSLLFPTTLFLIAGSVIQVINPGRPLFLPRAEIDAFQALKDKAPIGSGVLSSFDTGNSLPAWIPVRAVIGHGPETIGLAEIKAKIDLFFENPDQVGACQVFFDGLGAEYLFWGPEERRVWKLDPARLDCLGEIYNNNDYQLFEIR